MLLILAGITLTYVFGDNGIIKWAQDAKNQTAAGMQKEQDDIANLVNMLNKEYSGGSGTTNPPEQPDPPAEDKTVADIVDQIQDDTTTIEDENGNPITIPGGFRVLPHGTTSADIDEVIYNYDTNHKPCVQDGIVIADDEDNQFVWIPVGEIKNKEGDANGTTTTITLGRYTFDTTNGTPTLQQKATTDEADKDKANYYTKAVTIESYYQELASDSGNTAAKDLKGFIDSSKINGGYYLARYEASGGSNNTAGKVKSQYDKTAWVSIDEPTAATNCRNMYSSEDEESGFVESDLVNSYAWDTAIVFIQKYSGNSNYANQEGKSINSSKQNTGKAGDKVCNIHDMAANCFEWSTENSTFSVGFGVNSCVFRGGYYDSSGSSACRRGYSLPTVCSTYYSFRPLCWVK